MILEFAILRSKTTRIARMPNGSHRLLLNPSSGSLPGLFPIRPPLVRNSQNPRPVHEESAIHALLARPAVPAGLGGVRGSVMNSALAIGRGESH